VQSELNIIANITDNQAIYRCEAQNSATDVPLLDSKTLSVHCESCFTRGNRVDWSVWSVRGRDERDSRFIFNDELGRKLSL
jgi:hypothetical protein